jgi:glycosyltransferase involved in cell wall biosynthesis
VKLSVCIITYNQEQYIEQAVRSALIQETDFDYEIVIGEDCSTDRTRAILRDLQREHPHKIRLLLHEQNIGAHQNFVQTFHACSGEYVAHLEGDDFWTSPQKLQKQVDFLVAHPECAFCFHKATVLRTTAPETHDVLPAADVDEISSINILFGDTNPIPTCAVVSRNALFGEFPAWYYQLKLGDWPLHILRAVHGKIGYLPEIMASYRIHPQGAWSSLVPYQTIPYLIEMFYHINEYLNFEYNAVIEGTITNIANYWAWDLIASQPAEVQRQALSALVCTSASEVIQRLFEATIAKAMELERGRTWRDEQYSAWRAEAERRSAQIQEQRAWIDTLEQAKIWLEDQRANWQRIAEQHKQASQAQQEQIARMAAELERRKPYLRRLRQGIFRILARLGLVWSR